MRVRAGLASALSVVAIAPGMAMEGCAACEYSQSDPLSALAAGVFCGERDRGPNTAPVATFSMRPNPVRSGQEVTFDASEAVDPDGRIMQYLWEIDPADGVPFEVDAGDEAVIRREVTTTESGEDVRTVTLRVIDVRGETSSATGLLTVVGAPSPHLNIPPQAFFGVDPNPALPGQSIRFDASRSIDPEGGPLRFEWDFDGDGTLVAGGSDPVAFHAYETPGVREVRLKVTDLAGGFGLATRRVTVGAPSASAAGSGTRFAARIRSALVPGRGGTLTFRRSGLMLHDLVMRGRLRGRLVGRRRSGPPLRDFLSSRWVMRVSASAIGTPARLRGRGVALVRFADRRSGRACLRLRVVTRPGRPPSGRFRLVGATGPAAAIAAAGRFRFDSGAGTLRGRIASRRADLPPLPAACRRLARV